MKKGYLVLEDGTVFEGELFGAQNSCTGELVFTTGMCGYIETLTDPSYYGQIVLQTFPLIGNYGVIEADFEGECAVSGYVVREWCKAPSNFRAENDIDSFLAQKNVTGICGVDTREITRIIREHGVMNAIITDKLPKSADIDKIKSYKIENAVAAVSRKSSGVFRATTEKYRVTLLDFGAKQNIVRELVKHNCTVTVLPGFSSAEEIKKTNPDGIMLSNGPGDPAENIIPIKNIKELLGWKPIFGICLGHQLLALAAGHKTVKLSYGHRGTNQPVKEVCGNRTYITSQNHGYAVELVKGRPGSLSFINANDGTVEGIDYPEYNAFSVQFHPEACSGPHDTEFLFCKFADLLGGKK